MQPGGLGRGREPDRAVQALVVGDREDGRPELDRPRDEVVGRRGAVEEREVAVAVELGVSGHERVSGGRAQIVEQMFDSCQRDTDRSMRADATGTGHRASDARDRRSHAPPRRFVALEVLLRVVAIAAVAVLVLWILPVIADTAG